MARKPRFNLVGVPQHVIQRGNDRKACFFAHADYLCYLDCLSRARDKYGCAIHAYVLMTNHVHLLVTQEIDYGVSQMMQSVGRKYVRYINDAYRRTGTLWEGRYRASLIDAETYLLTCHRYIELNPVRAGMVTDPGDYHWSSYRSNGLGKPDRLVTPHERFVALGCDDEERRSAYRALVRQHVAGGTLQSIREALNREQVMGSDSFRDEIERQVGRRLKPGKAGRPRRNQAAY